MDNFDGPDKGYDELIAAELKSTPLTSAKIDEMAGSNRTSYPAEVPLIDAELFIPPDDIEFEFVL